MENSFATNLFTPNNASQTGTFAKEKVLDLKIMASDGDLSIRLLALLGGLGMIVTSMLGFLAHILTLNVVGALLEVYTFLLGFVVLILEGKRLPFPRTFEQRINKYALLLKFVWGRGCLYFVAGSLQLSQLKMLDVVAGVFMCFVGIMYILVGRQTARKLKELRKSLVSEETLKARFLLADSDRTGTLTQTQFQAMTSSLGLDLNRRETESAFIQLGKDEKDVLTYEEFKMWWTDVYDHDESPSGTAFSEIV